MNGFAHRPAVLITGGVRRLGFQFSLCCLDMGYDLLLPTRQFAGSPMQEWLSAKPSMTERVTIIACDISTDLTAIEKLFETLEISGLICAAALFIPDNPADPSLEQQVRHFNTDIPVQLTHLLAHNPAGCWAVHISDALIREGSTLFESYRASKRALETAVPALAEQYRGKMRVNAIAPGPMLMRGPEDQVFFDRMQDLSPQKRLPDAQEACASLRDLIRDGQRTGEIVCVDAGLRGVY